MADSRLRPGWPRASFGGSEGSTWTRLCLKPTLYCNSGHCPLRPHPPSASSLPRCQPAIALLSRLAVTTKPGMAHEALLRIATCTMKTCTHRDAAGLDPLGQGSGAAPTVRVAHIGHWTRQDPSQCLVPGRLFNGWPQPNPAPATCRD